MLNIHPLLVHFPIALLPMAMLLDFISVIFKKQNMAEAAWIVQLTGFFFLITAVASGLSAKGGDIIPVGAQAQVELHEQMAFITSALFTAICLWRAGARGKIPGQNPFLYLSIVAVSVGILLFTAWAGAELVYVFGTGVSLP